MSVTVPPKGTRGVPFPRFVVRLLSRFVPGMFRRRPNKTSGGIPTLLLETRGAKTGRTRHAMRTDREIPVLRLQRQPGEPQNA